MTHPHESARPASVSNATGLFYIAMVLGLLRAVLDWPAMTRTASAGFTLFVLTCSFGLLLLLIQQLGRGRNWARVTLLVLFILGLPFSFGPLMESLGTAPLSGILGILQMVFQVIGLGMLFSGTSARWFQAADHVDAGASADTKKCPFCAEWIRREAIKCRYCGSDLARA